MYISRHKKIFVFILVFYSLLIGIAFYLQERKPPSSIETKEFRIIEINKGDSLLTIAEKLKNAGVIRNAWVFALEALRTGAYKKFKAGEYALFPYQSVEEILKILSEGKVYLRKVVVPEGATIWQIAEILEKQKICRKEEFLSLAENEEFVKSLGIPSKTAEGFLFPDTYYFAKNTPPERVIKVMVNNFWEHWKKYEKVAEEKGLSLKEVITLASIVEKEALFSKEKPLIAAVYWNRLKIGMPLQADPTINYAIKKFRRLYYKDYYRVKSPYNTYLNKGLPPTPISNPGEKSIEAVLFPAKVSYLYFVARPNGTHYFSRTYREHLRAIRRIRMAKYKKIKNKKLMPVKANYSSNRTE